MTHDPWSLHASLSCPACHVTGKVVRLEREDGGYQCCDDEHLDDVDPYVCVECGQTWADTGVVGDVKDYRIAYGRLVEGRPYEPPRPKEPAPRKVDLGAYDGVLKDYYQRPTSGPTIGDLVERAKSIASWHMPAETYPTSTAGYALSMDTWSLTSQTHETYLPAPLDAILKVAPPRAGCDAWTPSPPVNVSPEALGLGPIRDAIPGSMRVVRVDYRNGAIVFQYEKK